MSNLLLLIVLIFLAIVYTGTRPAKDNRLVTILVLLLAVLGLCYVRYWMNPESFLDMNTGYNLAPLNYAMSGGCSGLAMPDASNIVFPDGQLMAYDNLVLKSTPAPKYPLLSDVTIFSPVGDGIRLTEDIDAKNFPTVDGKPGSPRHLFMLAHNQSRPECCPSTFSDSRGCVCLTPAQQEMINKREGNRSSDLYPGI